MRVGSSRAQAAAIEQNLAMLPAGIGVTHYILLNNRTNRASAAAAARSIGKNVESASAQSQGIFFGRREGTCEVSGKPRSFRDLTRPPEASRGKRATLDALATFRRGPIATLFRGQPPAACGIPPSAPSCRQKSVPATPLLLPSCPSLMSRRRLRPGPPRR